MDKNEIKKYLYKNKPKALLLYIRKEVAYYQTDIETEIVTFAVPIKDMGDADYFAEMDAQYLNRYILENE